MILRLTATLSGAAAIRAFGPSAGSREAAIWWESPPKMPRNAAPESEVITAICEASERRARRDRSVIAALVFATAVPGPAVR